MNVSSTSQPLVMATACGNLSLATEEECDDGNRQAGDGCNASCLIEEGWSCSEDEPSLCEPLCGDGLKLASEACDDGNTDNGDGCSQSCQSDAFAALR